MEAASTFLADVEAVFGTTGNTGSRSDAAVRTTLRARGVRGKDAEAPPTITPTSTAATTPPAPTAHAVPMENGSHNERDGSAAMRILTPARNSGDGCTANARSISRARV